MCSLNDAISSHLIDIEQNMMLVLGHKTCIFLAMVEYPHVGPMWYGGVFTWSPFHMVGKSSIFFLECISFVAAFP